MNISRAIFPTTKLVYFPTKLVVEISQSNHLMHISLPQTVLCKYAIPLIPFEWIVLISPLHRWGNRGYERARTGIWTLVCLIPRSKGSLSGCPEGLLSCPSYLPSDHDELKQGFQAPEMPRGVSAFLSLSAMICTSLDVGLRPGFAELCDLGQPRNRPPRLRCPQ